MLSENQKQKIEKRIFATVKLFFENNGLISDEDLARLLSIEGYETSSSTVGRDLTSEKTLKLIGEKDYQLISEIRQLNKIIGTTKGGKNSVSIHNVTKNDSGQFTGCERRKL